MSACRNHYDNLKVARGAPTEVIEAAYRALGEKYRPTSSRVSVLRVRKIIDSAYFVLSDPVRRMQHDEWIQQVEQQSILQVSFKRRISRVLDSAASRRVQFFTCFRRYRLHTAVLIIALVVAWPYLAAWSQLETTIPVAGTTHPVRTYQTASRAAIPAELESRKGPLLFGADENIPPMRRASAIAPQREQEVWAPIGEPVPISSRVLHNWRQVDPNGNPWPAFTGPIQVSGDLDCSQRVGNGLASSTIDNSGNGYDVFVKLVANPDSPSGNCSAAWIFVKARGKYTIPDVTAGQYSIFFRDLLSGTTEKTLTVALDSFSNDQVERRTEYYVTVYSRPDGNFRPIPISDDAFEAI
jgi:hypothetical protein